MPRNKILIISKKQKLHPLAVDLYSQKFNRVREIP